MTSKISHAPRERQNVEFPPHLMRVQFSHLAHLSEMMQWDLDFRQLESGQLRVPITTLHSSQFQVMEIGFNCRIHQRGITPQGMATFGIPYELGDEFKWLGASVDANSMINFEHPVGFEGLTGNYQSITFH